jgi:hypothetical protein
LISKEERSYDLLGRRLLFPENKQARSHSVLATFTVLLMLAVVTEMVLAA